MWFSFQEYEQAVQERAFDYNVGLLEGEEPISDAEMAELMGEKMGKPTLVADRGMGGVDWRLVQGSRYRYQPDAEPDMGTALIYQFNTAAETGDVVEMKSIRAEFDALIDDSDVLESASESVLAFMDREIARCDIEVIQGPQRPIAGPKCEASCKVNG